MQKQLSTFSAKVRETLSKINEQTKKLGWSSEQLFDKADVNKNGICEKPEFIQFFAKDLPVKGMTLPGDVE